MNIKTVKKASIVGISIVVLLVIYFGIVVKIGAPTTILSFSSNQENNQIILSITTNSTIPQKAKEFPLSESGVAFGYAWLGQLTGHDIHAGPGHFVGFMQIQLDPFISWFSASE